MSEQRKRLEITVSAPSPTPLTRRTPFLLVLSGRHVGELHRLAAGGEQVLGRGEGADILLEDEGISRRHAAIRSDGAGALLRDLGSRNGTWVGDLKVDERTISDGDRIRLGFGTDLKFTFADEREAAVQRDLVAAAYREPLTNLHNRRYFQEALGADFAAARRHGRDLALLMIDVDRFKGVNDTYGHLAGDEALRTVAAVLRAGVRREDHLARTGGDEFVVLAEADPDGATKLAEHLRRAVEEARCPLPGAEPLRLTISIGVAVSSGPPVTERGHGERELFEAADRALHEAKQQGRNRCKLQAPAGGGGAATRSGPPGENTPA